MARLFYIHFNEEELTERVRPLEEAGHEVGRHGTTHKAAKFETLPDIFILSLARLPSHNKAYADWIWEAKKRQSIPIIFVDGAEEQVEKFKERYPNAHFCGQDELLNVVERLM